MKSAALMGGRAGPGPTFYGPGRAEFQCILTGRAEVLSGRAGLSIFGPCRALEHNRLLQ